MKKVFILTWCNNINQLYGSLLVFNSIRIGFPTAEIFVVDNFSIKEATIQIENCAKSINAKFYALNEEIKHHQHIEHILLNCNEEDEIYIVDPDVIFWDNVENYKTDKIIAGRLIPEFNDNYSKTLTKERLHTSFLVFQNIKLLRKKLLDIKAIYFESDLIKPIMVKNNDNWIRWDTTAQLFEVLKDDCEVFNDNMNDKFDHIFCGSHINLITDKWDLPEFKEIHNLSKNNPTALRGIWRYQHDFFLRQGNL
jgi:hypothetical protein